jgi:predicted phage tail protein
MESKVLLLDDLGKKYGETHVYYNLKTPAEAIKLLCINYPEFAKDVFKLQEQGIFYKVQQVDIDLELSDLFLPLGSHDLVVTPVISGSGDVGKFVLGGLMIGVGIISGGAGFGVGGALGFGSTTGAFSLAATVGNVGIAMVLSGIGDLLTPQPTLSTMDTEGAFTNYNSGPASLTKGADGTQTYAYTGATNSSGLGKTIPVAYGKVLAGSLLIGAQIDTKTTQKSNTDFFRQPGLDTFTLNGDPLTTKFRMAGGIKARLRKVKAKIKTQGGRRYLLNKNLNFKGAEQFINSGVTVSGFGGSIQGEKSGGKKTKLFTMIFQIKGLNDRPGDNDTAFIDGFITYQVIIKASSGSEIVGQHQITVQGLLKSTQNIRYQINTPYGHVQGKNSYKVFVKVIDSSVGKNCKFSVRGIGYKLK